jgi:hypothetical protein
MKKGVKRKIEGGREGGKQLSRKGGRERKK